MVNGGNPPFGTYATYPAYYGQIHTVIPKNHNPYNTIPPSTPNYTTPFVRGIEDYSLLDGLKCWLRPISQHKSSKVNG